MAALCSCLLTATAPAAPGGSWHNTSLSSAARASNLIGELTLNEKVSLLQVSQPRIERVGLPSYNFGRECERGDVSGKLGTTYPTGLALGGTFDVELVHAIAVATAVEVRGNVNTDTGSSGSFGASCFGPVSNLVRDPRWGRAAEMVTGEDPQLGRLMSRAFTWGMQSQRDNRTGARMLNTIAKHLNTYGGPEGTGFTFGATADRFNFEAKLPEREWREFFLPPFFGAAEAGVTGFMCSYSSITFTDHPEHSSNTPACANKYMLTDVVRGEWNWTGYILSDAGATAFVGKTQVGKPGELWHESNKSFGHGYASSQEDAAIKALDAGLDLELTCCGAPAVYPRCDTQ
jgi:beta-glucosidase